MDKHVVYYLGFGKYYREKIISIVQDIKQGMKCDKCKQNTKIPVICADNSDDEYGKIRICKECLLKIFNDFDNQSDHSICL